MKYLRITFEMSELGRMKRLLPLHEMAVNFGLVSNRKERRPKLSVREETTTLWSQKNIRKYIFTPHYANTLRSPVVLLHGLTSVKTAIEYASRFVSVICTLNGRKVTVKIPGTAKKMKI